MFYLSKLLPLFVYPAGLAWLILLGLTVFDLWQRQWTGRSTAVFVAMLVLWLGGNHYVAHILMHQLEKQYPPLEIERYSAETIVVLGGSTRWQLPPRQIPEINERGDRLIYANYLYQQGVADQLVLTGGWVTWEDIDGDDHSEARDMATLLSLMGVPAEDMWLEPESLNTYENGIYTKALLDEKGILRIVLVTTAAHMPRSVAVFEQQGFEVIPAPADFFVTQPLEEEGDRFSFNWRYELLYLVPQSEYVEMTTFALKEYIGLMIYRLRGWI